MRTLSTFVLLAAMALPGAAQVVISQVYGGGGNSGATFTHDYVELFNRGNQPVPLAGWCLQYASSAGSFTLGNNQNVNLGGTIQASSYYLIQLGQGTGGTVALPTPDASGLTAASASNGKFALLNSCVTALAVAEGTTGGRIVDFVGYGSASQSEGTPAPALTNTNAAFRAAAGCTDTNNNSADFATGNPQPRNSATATNPCSGPAPLSFVTALSLPDATAGTFYTVTIEAQGGTPPYVFSTLQAPPGLTLASGGVLSGIPATAGTFSFDVLLSDSSSSLTGTFQLKVNPVGGCAPTHTIAQIQGSGPVSPLSSGTTVTTSGIVTARRSNGFYLQMPAPGDSNPATSDGIFVFTSSAPPAAAAVSNSVCVTGPVVEFIPSSDPNSPPLTEITTPNVVTLVAAGLPLPAPVEITAADTNPAGGVHVLERLEGMRVRIGLLNTISGTAGNVNETNATGSNTGVFYGVVNGVARPFREAGIQEPDPLPAGSPCCVPRFDANPERIRVDSDAISGTTAVTVTAGATVANLQGVLDYSFRTYSLYPEAPGIQPADVSGLVSATPVPAAGANQFTVAAYNMQRFYDTVNDPSTGDAVLTATAFANRLNKASLGIRNVLQSPDVLAVVEMENLNALQLLAGKVNADVVAASQPDPGYIPFLVEGNDVGGINVGFLIKSSRVNVVSVTQFGKNDTFVNPNTGQPEILNDRPPLVLRATVTKPGSLTPTPLTVIVNHLRSLNGVDDPADGNRVRIKRRAQAEFLATLIQTLRTANPAEPIVSVGDYNAFEVNDGLVDVMGIVKGAPAPANQTVLPGSILVTPALVNLTEQLSANARYSYVFDGNAQVLDHMLVTTSLLPRLASYQVAHLNAEFPETFRSDPNRPERLSDHDVPVLYINLAHNTDISGAVTVTGSGLLFNRVTNTFNQTLTVRNKSNTAIAGPVSVLIRNLPAGVTLANATGLLNGVPYLTNPGGLAPNGTLSFALRFANPNRVAITYATTVLGGTVQ